MEENWKPDPTEKRRMEETRTEESKNKGMEEWENFVNKTQRFGIDIESYCTSDLRKKMISYIIIFVNNN